MADGGYFLTATKEKNSSGAGDGTRRGPVSPSECARSRALSRAMIVPPSRQASDSLRVFLDAAVSRRREHCH